MPDPPNYGGVIDVFYKISCLHARGVKVHLHCFTSGREASEKLENLCEEVYYYRRQTGVLSNLSVLPYTVRSRISPELRKNLLLNDYPILFEVLHTCYLMGDKAFRQRKKIFRHSNIEHEYYKEIAKSERKPFRKLFHLLEAIKLRRFEKVLKHASLILAVNQKDCAYFQENFRHVPTVFLPSFHPNKGVTALAGRGDYVLIHGNLAVAENSEAALWLIRNVLSRERVRTIVAGLNPPEFLSREIRKHAHISLEAGPPEQRMNELIGGAHIHLLYTAQPTGLKLKLLNVLFRGRFIITNNNMLSGTGLFADESLRIVKNAEGYRDALRALMHRSFDEPLLASRKRMIRTFDNNSNTDLLLELLFSDRKLQD